MLIKIYADGRVKNFEFSGHSSMQIKLFNQYLNILNLLQKLNVYLPSRKAGYLRESQCCAVKTRHREDACRSKDSQSKLGLVYSWCASRLQ